MIFDFLFLLAVIWMAVSLAYTNSWHWRERDAHTDEEALRANKKWHRWQYWGVLVPSFLLFFMLALVSINPYMVGVSIPVWWIMFDGVAARRLGKKWWYVGATSTIDKLIKSPVPKFLLLGGTVVLYILSLVGVI